MRTHARSKVHDASVSDAPRQIPVSSCKTDPLIPPQDPPPHRPPYPPPPIHTPHINLYAHADIPDTFLCDHPRLRPDCCVKVMTVEDSLALQERPEPPSDSRRQAGQILKQARRTAADFSLHNEPCGPAANRSSALSLSLKLLCLGMIPFVKSVCVCVCVCVRVWVCVSVCACVCMSVCVLSLINI